MRTRIVSAATIGLLFFGLAGCEEATYEQAPAPQQTAAPEPETPVRSGTGGSGTAYGGAMKAAHRTADRIEDQQRRIEDEIDY